MPPKAKEIETRIITGRYDALEDLFFCEDDRGRGMVFRECLPDKIKEVNYVSVDNRTEF